jgi:arsenate reductase-like glutaredoxin family protein
MLAYGGKADRKAKTACYGCRNTVSWLKAQEIQWFDRTGSQTMNVADFEDLLERLGDDVFAWPAPQQHAAVILLRSSDEARLALEEARLLRRALSVAPIRARGELTDRIMRGVSQAPAPAAISAEPARSRNGGLAFLISLRSPGFILAFCFFVGIFVGLYPHLLSDGLSEIDFPRFIAYAMDISHVTD